MMMKRMMLALLAVGLAGWARCETGTLDKSGEWNLPAAAYGQMRLESAGDETPGVRQDWDGPWSDYAKYRLVVGYAEGRQEKPEQYDFVDPVIELEGLEEKGRESHACTVTLFSGASKKDDIAVQWLELPKDLALGQEYKAAVISGKRTSRTWTVYVRFAAEKPAYIRAKGK